MKATLLLENGMTFVGNIKGSEETKIGEVIFNTTMVGYQEILTDPSYKDKLLCMTFPEMGNYGINSFDFESYKVGVKGFIAKNITDFPNNFRCEKTLDCYLKENNVTALTGIDTRALTRILRSEGIMNGAIIPGELSANKIDEVLLKIKNYNMGDVTKEVSVKEVKEYITDGNLNVVVYDFGVKKSLIDSLNYLGINVYLVPFDTPFNEILKYNPKGIILSGGPGNPKDLLYLKENILDIINSKIPLYGIGVGHCLIALDMGFDTYKLKHGHNGANYPVKDLKSGRTYITGQNICYAVDEKSIKDNIGRISHKNINDNTIEGIKYIDYPMFSTQFYPDVPSNFKDTFYILNDFKALTEERKNA